MPSVPVVSVRITKAVAKAFEDLHKSVESCPDAKTQRLLVKIEKTLRGAMMPSQKGGMASLSPAMLNVSGDFIDNSRDAINAGQGGYGLLNVPAPFSDAVMGAGSIFTEQTAPLYVPNTPSPVAAAAATTGGGASKKRQQRRPRSNRK
jgi:hypothetical protein